MVEDEARELLLEGGTAAVNATEISVGKNAANAGKSNVPRPNPVTSVSAEASAAIGQIQKYSKARVCHGPVARRAAKRHGGAMLKPDDPAPDCSAVDHHGKAVSLRDFSNSDAVDSPRGAGQARRLMARGDSFSSLVEMMERLLAPDGCPWDREQTFESLKSYLLEEAHEVIEAIDSGDASHHREELGDLLFQVVFQAALARSQGRFDVDEVVAAIRDKLVRRHPHIFGEAQVNDAAEQVRVWERIKAEERAAKGERAGVLCGVPRGLPALQRAWRLGEKAGAVGFDWTSPDAVLDKVREELFELNEARNREESVREMGDLLFALAQLSRHLGFDPEDALRLANDRFRGRFEHIEDRLREEGSAPARAGMERMEALWQEAKAKEANKQ